MAEEKTWTLKIDSHELRALIRHHADSVRYGDDYTLETAARIHDLSKRLNKQSVGNENAGETAQPVPEPAPAPVAWPSN